MAERTRATIALTAPAVVRIRRRIYGSRFPHQEGSSLNAGNIGYGTLKMQDALQRLKEVEGLSVPTNSHFVLDRI
jgi:hypothetical protein